MKNGGKTKREFIENAEKKFNKDIKKWEYKDDKGMVLITAKTEKGLDSEWEKYKKVWEMKNGGELEGDHPYIDVEKVKLTDNGITVAKTQRYSANVHGVMYVAPTKAKLKAKIAAHKKEDEEAAKGGSKHTKGGETKMMTQEWYKENNISPQWVSKLHSEGFFENTEIKKDLDEWAEKNSKSTMNTEHLLEYTMEKHPEVLPKMADGGQITGSDKFRKVMGEFKRGDLKSGGSGDVVTERDQAIAIAFSEAREIEPTYGKYADGGELFKTGGELMSEFKADDYFPTGDVLEFFS